MQKVNNMPSHLELQARPELLAIVESVARDRGISVEEVFDAMESAIKKVSAMKYGTMHNIRAKINRNNGAITVQKIMNVVEEVENSYQEISINEAKTKYSDVVLGDEIIDILPTPSFSRGGVQSFRQVVVFKIKEAEKIKEYELYKDKVGEIVSGVVKRVEFGSIFVELTNRAEAVLRRDQIIPRENLEVGSRIRALIIDVKKDMDASQIILSRSSPSFIIKLFAQEIPEVYEGTIEVKGIARIAGSRTKIALWSRDNSIDAVSVCIGFKGARIHGILSELRGEKIDLVHWSDNTATYIINAFYPTSIVKVIVDEDKKVADVVINSSNLGLAIGREGQNISLISKLIGWKIDVMSEEQEKDRRGTYTESRIKLFKEAIDVDDVIAQLLVVEGFNSVKDILEDSRGVLKTIPGFNEDIIEEIKSRSKDYLDKIAKETDKQDKKFDKSLLNLLSNYENILVELEKENIFKMKDFSELSAFDLLDIINDESKLSQEIAEELILKARNINV